MSLCYCCGRGSRTKKWITPSAILAPPDLPTLPREGGRDSTDSGALTIPLAAHRLRGSLMRSRREGGRYKFNNPAVFHHRLKGQRDGRWAPAATRWYSVSPPLYFTILILRQYIYFSLNPHKRPFFQCFRRFTTFKGKPSLLRKKKDFTPKVTFLIIFHWFQCFD